MTTHTDAADRKPPILVLAGPANARRARFDELALAAQGAGKTVFRTSIHLTQGGPWVGIRDLVRTILPELERDAPELLDRHRYELSLALPELRSRYPLKEASLTDAAPVKERVRSYPINRAFRLVHGLIDLFGESLDRHPEARYWIGCDDFDRAGALGRLFILELDRRLGGRGTIELALGCEADGAAAATRDFPVAEVEVLGAADGESADFDPQAAESEAAAIESQLDDDLKLAEIRAPRLVYLWERCGRPERALRWRVALLAIYNHFGYYEDALAFGEPVLPRLEEAIQGDRAFSRWHVVSGLFNAYVAMGRTERALELVETEALSKVTDPTDLISIHYSMAMLHARFLPRKNLALAEKHLQDSLAYAAKAPLSDADKAYLEAFNWNGLAFIRHLQGSPADALELCQRAYESLRIHLSEEQHRLHRSVLLYNIAQVHASLRNLPAAIESYTAAMEIDPRYSEYYNERGSAYFGLGQADLAIADFLQAIELSAPYPEVWTNLGQAYRFVDRNADAVAAYSRALDLDPGSVLSWIGRAQARADLGAFEAAIADYGEAIAREPRDSLLLSNRGALFYELGRFAESLDDLEAAVAVDPENEDLRDNRALALSALQSAQAVPAAR